MKKINWRMKLKTILVKKNENLGSGGVFERKIGNWGSKYNLSKLCHVGRPISNPDEPEHIAWQATLTRYHAGGYAGDPRVRDRTVQIRSRAHKQPGSVPSPDAIGRSDLNAMNGPNPLSI